MGDDHDKRTRAGSKDQNAFSRHESGSRQEGQATLFRVAIQDPGHARYGKLARSIQPEASRLARCQEASKGLSASVFPPAKLGAASLGRCDHNDCYFTVEGTLLKMSKKIIERTVLAVDTEDDSKGKVKIINFFDGHEHVTFAGPNQTKIRKQAYNYMYSRAPATLWACNAEYDLLNLFSHWIGYLSTLMYVSSGLMRAYVTFCPVQVYDTLRHWPIGVAGMGNYLGLPKLEADFESIEYCRRDTEIVWLFVREMTERYQRLGLQLKATLPAMAMQLFKQFYNDDFELDNKTIKGILRDSYYGGRVEVFRLGEVSGPFNHYDINSLFPSVMRDFKFPVPKSYYLAGKPDFKKEGVFQGFLDHPKLDICNLPVRAGNELIYPHGSLYGTWPYPEIRRFLDDGGKIVHCERAIEFEKVESPFVRYVDFCYNQRIKATDELDKVFWKLMLNSLYGKFGQSRGLTIIHQNKERVISSESSYSNVIWSSYVTSHARVRLLESLRQCSEVYYTDTDSIFTPDRLPVSNELGKFKLEGIVKKGFFAGNKLYILDDKARAKGVPRSIAADFIRTGRGVFRKPARLRESRMQGLKVNYWYEVEKHLKKEYTKRKVGRGGFTESWDLQEYNQVNV